MANLISDPGKLMDEAGASPPSYWNGSSYDFLSGYGPAIRLIYTGTVAAGDVVSFLVTNHQVSDRSTHVGIWVNGSEVLADDLQTIGVKELTTGPLSAGDDVFVMLAANGGFAVYSLDCNISPLGESHFWTDFVGCIEV